VYLLDTNVVSELRRPKPHGAVLQWIGDIPAEAMFLSAVTIGEIQAGIEITREQDRAKADSLELWLGQVIATYRVLPMDAFAFQAWARLKHRKSDTLLEDAMIAALQAIRSTHRKSVYVAAVRSIGGAAITHASFYRFAPVSRMAISWPMRHRVSCNMPWLPAHG
jgi:predicted nucleic acid-binding protein